MAKREWMVKLLIKERAAIKFYKDHARRYMRVVIDRLDKAAVEAKGSGGGSSSSSSSSSTPGPPAELMEEETKTLEKALFAFPEGEW